MCRKTREIRAQRFCGHACSMLSKWAEPGYKPRLLRAQRGKFELGHGLGAEARAKISQKQKGIHRSPATQFKKGLIPWNKGKPWPEMKALWAMNEHRDKVLPKILAVRPPFRDTRIELRLQALLTRLHMKFETHVYVGHVTKIDVAFPKQKVAVYADGCYYHLCPHCGFGYGKPSDQRIDRILEREGWLVLRYWEHELMDDKALSEIGQEILSVLTLETEEHSP
jgi:DNA mismatch endonuclease, patch repair protein